MIPSRDIDNQRIMQSDWLRAFQAITEEQDVRFYNTSMVKFLAKAKKHYFGGILGAFFPKREFF